MSLIVARNLTKWYGKTRAVDDLNLEVDRGEVFGFLGPNAVPPALVVGALSLLGSCALRRRRHAAIVGAAFLAASHFLNILGQVAEPIRPWRHLSIFHAYTASQPLTGDLITNDTAWLLAVVILLVAAATFAFGRKELGRMSQQHDELRSMEAQAKRFESSRMRVIRFIRSLALGLNMEKTSTRLGGFLKT